MPLFRNKEHLYKVLGTLFERAKEDQKLTEILTKSKMIIRFVFKEPDASITIDLREKPIKFFFDECSLTPDVEMTQDADTAHQFWLGKLNVPLAIATRKVIARGSVPKALALLPAVKPLYSLYPLVLKEIGEEKLLVSETKKKRINLKQFFNLLPKGKFAKIDFGKDISSIIPLVESSEEKIQIRTQKLPSDEKELKIEMLRRMILIRAFEEKLKEKFATGEIPTEAIHLSIGQEACAVGACFALEEGDYLTTTHRGHGHMIARGADIQRMLAEIFGKSTGLCRGLGGSMHVTDAELGALGANGIVGASGLIATGAGLTLRLNKRKNIAIAFMGDGSTAQGMFHEAVNFSAVFDLPVIFFIENNQYAEFTPLRGHTRLEKLSERAKGYGIEGITIDGNDVWQVYTTVRKVRREMVNSPHPVLIEAITYRFSGHTEGESAIYRTQEEIEEWKKKDPITRWVKYLISNNLIAEEDATKIKKEVEINVEEALNFAKSSPEPEFKIMQEVLFAPEPEYLYKEQESTPQREITVAQALREALAEEMRRDERVFLVGEDVTTGGYFSVTTGLVEEFGKERIIDTPISEYAIAGSAVGSAMTGMRPVVEIEFSDFITCCMDPIVNQAAKLRFMSGGQYRIPLVIRTPGGSGIGMAAQHSQSLEAWLLHIPGLIVIAPSNPYDAKGLLKSAIRSNNPVIFFENKLLYAQTGKIPEGEYIAPIGKARIMREGRDLTIIAVGAMVIPALSAAERLSEEGIEAEVIDPRTLSPCDWKTILNSVLKTRRAVIVEEGALTSGFGAECSARITESLFKHLKAPVKRIAGLDFPIPYAKNLETAVVPDIERIVKETLGLF